MPFVRARDSPPRAALSASAPPDRVLAASSRFVAAMGENLGHVVYRGPEGETTEWDDIQRRLGNKPPLASSAPRDDPGAGPAFAAEAGGSSGGADARAARLDAASSADALVAMEDDFADDGFLEAYRLRRMAELRARSAVPRFGAIVPVTRASFTREVTDASSDHHVVVFLHRPNCPDCERLDLALRDLAPRFPLVKFTSALAGECIPGYPDRNVPTLVLYRGRDAKRSFVGLDAFGGANHITPEGVRLAINETGRVLVPEGEDPEEGSRRDEEARRRYAEGIVARLVKEGRNRRREAMMTGRRDDF